MLEVVFTNIYGGNNVRVTIENHHECTILPSINIVGRDIHISTSTRMLALPSTLLPHNIYLNNDIKPLMSSYTFVYIEVNFSSKV